MPNQYPCRICGTLSEAVPPHCHCPRCGKYRIPMAIEVWSIIEKSDKADQAKISGWVSDQNRTGTVPTISGDVLKKISARPLPTVAERAERLLLEMLQGQNKLELNAMVNITEPRFAAATYSQDVSEVYVLEKLLSDKGYVYEVADAGIYRVLPQGYIAADELTRRVAQSDKGFVAMAFCKDLEPAYDKGFQVGVLKAGYDPVRIDRVEHTNRIDDEIIAHIRTAFFVVADFTGHRNGVYFEAGFALGLDLPVIWTCRKGDMQDLHFDIRQYNTIDWENPEDLATRLQYRIEASVGKGPKTVLDS